MNFSRYYREAFDPNIILHITIIVCFYFAKPVKSRICTPYRFAEKNIQINQQTIKYTINEFVFYHCLSMRQSVSYCIQIAELFF